MASGSGVSGGSWDQSSLAGEEAQEGAALLRYVIANRAVQHGVSGFECVQDGALGDRALHFDLHFLSDVR